MAQTHLKQVPCLQAMRLTALLHQLRKALRLWMAPLIPHLTPHPQPQPTPPPTCAHLRIKSGVLHNVTNPCLPTSKTYRPRFLLTCNRFSMRRLRASKAPLTRSNLYKNAFHPQPMQSIRASLSLSPTEQKLNPWLHRQKRTLRALKASSRVPLMASLTRSHLPLMEQHLIPQLSQPQ